MILRRLQFENAYILAPTALFDREDNVSGGVGGNASTLADSR